MKTSPSAPPATVDAQNPWLGLVSYTEENRAYFHGRDEEARELVRRLERKTLTILFGQSGLGKSSLLQAGVFPRLRATGFVPIYVRLDHGPDAPPLAEQIKPAVYAATTMMGKWSHPGSAAPGESLWEYFHHRDDVLHGGSGQQLIPVLVFDQFEELFTLGAADDATRARALTFIADLADLVENRAPASFEARVDAGAVSAEAFDFARSDYRVLITLREDYLPHLESLKAAMPSLMQNRMRLTRLSGAQALEAVVKPSPGLVPEEVALAIVAFVSGRSDPAQAEVEPSLLSLVCRELNYRRRAAKAEQIDAALLAGSRETILTEFYERTMADQSPAVRHWVENDLLTDSGYRENVALERAKKSLVTAGADPAAIDVLVSRRLLRIEERLDVRRIELTHDVLCAVVRASRDSRREREAKEAAERQLAETTAKEAAAQRSLRRARMIAAGCAVLAVIAIGSAVFGYVGLRRARAAEEQAVRTRRLADTARSQAEYLVSYLIKDLEPVLEQYGRLPQLKQLAEKAIAYFAALPPEVKSLDSARGEAKASLILAMVQDAQGDREAWRKSVGSLIAQLEKIVAAAPADAEYRVYLLAARCWEYDYTIDYNKFSDKDQAFFDKALAEVQALAANHADNLEVVRMATQLQGRYLGNVTFEYAQKHQGQIVEKAERLRAQWQDIIKREPDNKFNRVWYAAAISEQGNIYGQVHDQAKSLAYGKEAVDYAEQAVKADPGNVALLEAVARAAQLLSYQAGASDRKLMREAELIARERNRILTEIDPTNQRYRAWYVAAHHMEGYEFQAEGRWQEARDIFKKYRTLFEALPADTRNQFSPGAAAEACADEGFSAAAMGDFAAARSLLQEVREKSRALTLDQAANDPATRRSRVLRVVRYEISLASAMHDWAETERSVREIQPEITAALLAKSDDVEFLLRQAEVDGQLGRALLGQGRLTEAVQVLGKAVAEFDATPPTLTGLSYTRAFDMLNARERWAEALTVTGDPAQARGVLEPALKAREQNLARENNWNYQSSVARTVTLLAATFDPAKSDEATQRTALLDRAEGLLTAPGASARYSVDDKDTLARIAALRAGK